MKEAFTYKKPTTLFTIYVTIANKIDSKCEAKASCLKKYDNLLVVAFCSNTFQFLSKQNKIISVGIQAERSHSANTLENLQFVENLDVSHLSLDMNDDCFLCGS